MPKKIHYQHPHYTTRHHACGIGDLSSIVLTSNLNEVTCGMCLNTTIGKGSNRQINDRPKVKPGWRLDQDLIDAVRDRAKESGLSQTAIVESALNEYLK